MLVCIQVVQTVCVETRSPTHNSMDLITLFEQQFRPEDPLAKVRLQCRFYPADRNGIRHTTEGWGALSNKTIANTTRKIESNSQV